MIQGIVNALDDPLQALWRWRGRQSSGITAYGSRNLLQWATGVQNPHNNPADIVAAARTPGFGGAQVMGEAAGVARMKKLHYGAFYKDVKGGRVFGPQNKLLQRTFLSTAAENELLKKGFGKFGWRSGLIQGRPLMGLSVGIGHFKGAVPFAIGGSILEGFTARRGHKVSGMVGGFAKGIGFGLGDLIGTTLGGPALGQVFGLAGERVGASIEEGIQMLHDFHKQVKHINMGGHYEDTRIAYTMRQRAAQEMGSSVMNARQWLGREALLMHQ